MTNKHKRYLLSILVLAFLLVGSIVACEKQAPPSPPAITARPSSFSFIVEQGEPNPPSQTLNIWNSSNGMLSWSISDSAPWLSVSSTSGSSSGEVNDIAVSVNTLGMSTGSYAAIITIAALGASNTPQAIVVNLTINPPPVHEPEQMAEQTIDALDTDKLLEIGYNYPEEVVTVEGVIVRTHYAKNSKGKPTFLDFHDPYEGYFQCVIWQEDRQTGKPIRGKFIEAFPPNPETYFLNKQVRVEGKIKIYKGTPEIVLDDPSQIWIVEYEDAVVTKVIDGDTIEIENGVRVRYIGIDTPEIGEHYYLEATEANRQLVGGKRIQLEKDVEDKDEYGRLLRYVWVDGIMVNAELVRLGYAYSYSYPPNLKYQAHFLQLEREAREQKRGLWSE
ncbi:MAG: thermonuclease family protein [Dehalococcoidia bacterium]|nr:thermonuclease family protein [Dehalococcoidia bacterium]